MSHPVRSHALPVCLTLALVGLAGCSDQSRYVMSITQITPLSTNGGNTMQADLIGNFSSAACSVVEDLASVVVQVERPSASSVGPNLGSYVTGYSVEYYYYEPTTGVLSGPVSFLTTRADNLRMQPSVGGFGTATLVLQIPMVTYELKAWSSGATRNGIAGYGGALRVNRVIAKLTVTGEDTTGKRMSADGSILISLNDYAVGPTARLPGDPVTSSNCCYNDSPFTFWSGQGLCGQP